MAHTHTVMPKKLAQALMDSSMQHFDVGGTAQPAPASGATSTFTSGVQPAGAAASNQNSSFFGAITPQNTYSANAPAITTQDLSGVIQQGQQNQNQVYGQQQSLAQTLLNTANGNGPSVAQNQLAQTTGTNVANTAANIAGARGSSGNVGLMTRLAAQQGANTQQTATGQAATLRAGETANAATGAANVLNEAGTQNLTGESINQGAQASQNSAITTGELGAQQINSGISQQNANNTASTESGIIGGAASAISSFLYKGGKVPTQKFDVGGIANYAVPTDPHDMVTATAGTSPWSNITSLMKLPSGQASPMDGATSMQGQDGTEFGGSSIGDSGASGLMGVAQEAGPLAMIAASHGGKIPSDFRSGGPVPGQAQVPGKNDPRNDTVPAMLSPGEEVLPLSVTTAKDPEKKAVEFMRHLKNQKDGGDVKPSSYGQVLEARKKMKRSS